VTVMNGLRWIAARTTRIMRKPRVRSSLMAVVAAIFFGQAYLVRELFAAEVFFVLAFLGVTAVVGAVYLIGSVTLSWWAQGKPDVEEVHADLSEGSIDS
jgi:hypothetical protein